MTPRLVLLAGPQALSLVRERGLRLQDVDLLVGASGGPKWIALHGIDRFLARFFAPRARPLPMVGASIGAFRHVALALREPEAALARFREAYFAQRFGPRPTAAEVSRVSEGVLDALLGRDGPAELLSHPFARLALLTNRARGLAASEARAAQGLALALAAGANLLTRRSLPLTLERVVFHAGPKEAFATFEDLPTRFVPLDPANVRAAILASGSIPLAMAGVRFPGGPPGVFRDGGVVDYHPVLDFADGPGLVLYPHFFPKLVPGWFDQRLPWRGPRAEWLRRVLLVAPNPARIAALPGGRVPDRRDFTELSDEERLARWHAALAEAEAAGEELAELVESGRIREAVRPFP